MYRLWGKIISRNSIVQQYTAECNDTDLSKEECLNICIDQICNAFDIQKPLWLPLNKRDYKNYGSTQFRADCFMEEIDYDFFEIEYIKEEKKKKTLPHQR